MLWKRQKVYDKILLCKSIRANENVRENHIEIMINNVEKRVLLKKYMTEQVIMMTENLQKWR